MDIENAIAAITAHTHIPINIRATFRVLNMCELDFPRNCETIIAQHPACMAPVKTIAVHSSLNEVPKLSGIE